MLLLETIKNFIKEKSIRMIKKDIIMAEDQISDHNNIDFIMKIRMGLKIAKFMIIIFNLSYFIGMGWLLFTELMQIMHNDWYNAALKAAKLNIKMICEENPENYCWDIKT